MEDGTGNAHMVVLDLVGSACLSWDWWGGNRPAARLRLGFGGEMSISAYAAPTTTNLSSSLLLMSARPFLSKRLSIHH
jgi:hypothetical protein